MTANRNDILLLKDNKEPFRIDIPEVLVKFKNSKYFKDKSREFDTRLALFIADKEPIGMQSTFLKSNDFIKLLEIAKVEFRVL